MNYNSENLRSILRKTYSNYLFFVVGVVGVEGLRGPQIVNLPRHLVQLVQGLVEPFLDGCAGGIVAEEAHDGGHHVQDGQGAAQRTSDALVVSYLTF